MPNECQRNFQLAAYLLALCCAGVVWKLALTTTTLRSLSVEMANDSKEEEDATTTAPAFYLQNESFHKSLPCIVSWLPNATTTGAYHHVQKVVPCGEWAYSHVWKSGGTTSMKQCRHGSNSSSKLHPQQPSVLEEHVYLQSKIFTFVRDPIDHFISGFKECAARREYRQEPGAWLPTNTSVAEYLQQKGRGCSHHSIPQINYLIYKPKAVETSNLTLQVVVDSLDASSVRFLKQIAYVGDMADIESFFQYQGLPWAPAKVVLRHYTGKDAFSGLRHKLSDNVLFQICDHVKIDYCFFDYTPPEVCREMVHTFCSDTCRAG